MTRRRRQSSLVLDFAEPFAEFPLWVGLVVAAFLVVGGLVLTRLHVASVGAMLILVIAPWFLWLLGLATLAYALKGAVSRRWDRRLFDRSAGVAGLDPYQFERYVGDYYRRRAWHVTPRGGRSADGGVDMIVERAGERLVVQCKHWKAWTVGPRPLRELWGVIDDEHATGAVFVTSGRFTAAARAFAGGKSLTLVDGDGLAAIVGEVRAGSVEEAHQVSSPACPRCGAPMVVRTATRGSRIGERFLGCSRFPGCRQVVQLEAVTAN